VLVIPFFLKVAKSLIIFAEESFTCLFHAEMGECIRLRISCHFPGWDICQLSSCLFSLSSILAKKKSLQAYNFAGRSHHSECMTASRRACM